jgi:hypothetical protein
VVAVTHQDMPADERMAREVPSIDLVIGGPEHDRLESVLGGMLITKAGADGVFVVRIDLQATRDGKVLARQHRFIAVTPDLLGGSGDGGAGGALPGSPWSSARRLARRVPGAAGRAHAALRAGETTLATGSPTSCEPACTPTWPSAIERARVIAPAIEGRIVPASP